MDGVIPGHSATSNTLIIYSPRNKQYYKLDSYMIDLYHLPGLVYSIIKYDGGLFCSLYHDAGPSYDEPYRPGTGVECQTPVSNVLRLGTAMGIHINFSVAGTKRPTSSNLMMPQQPRSQLHK